MLFALPVVASAHHSANEFDQTTVVEVEGKIVDVFWRNPHVIIKVATVEDGEEVVWALEGASVSNQRRRGMNKDMLTSGASVRAAGYASTRQLNHMLLSNLLLPDGAELLLRRASAPRWANSSFGRTELAMDAAKVSAAEATAEGIFRVWTWGRATRGWWFFGGPENFPLTEKGLATLDGYNEYEDNPVLKCIPPGMAATMGNPYPIEFVQVGDNIEYHSEEFDRVRTIHLNADPDADVDPSPLGYSVGHWEDENTLVIKTTKINAPYFNRVGVRQSEDVEVDERFSFDGAANRLHYELSIVDPQTLTEPYEFGGHWNWAPGEEVGRYECAVAE
jgi:hypothetical protein